MGDDNSKNKSKKGKEYDFRDIDVILIRNLPTDTESLTNAWLKLRGLVSDKSIISHLPFGLDAESELAEMDKQNQENIQKFRKYGRNRREAST